KVTRRIDEQLRRRAFETHAEHAPVAVRDASDVLRERTRHGHPSEDLFAAVGALEQRDAGGIRFAELAREREQALQECVGIGGKELNETLKRFALPGEIRGPAGTAE